MNLRNRLLAAAAYFMTVLLLAPAGEITVQAKEGYDFLSVGVAEVLDPGA